MKPDSQGDAAASGDAPGDAPGLSLTRRSVLEGAALAALWALGGIYIGGGIVPRFGERFFESHFRERFEDKLSLIHI